MKRLIALAGLAALVACDRSEPPPAPEPTVEETEVALTTANGSPPGTYIATAADGTETTSVLNPDGTYLDMDAEGNVVAEGSWQVVDGKTCFTPRTEGIEPMCFTETPPGPDGSFTATPDSGDPLTVRPGGSTTIG